MDTLVDLFDGALARFADRPALSIRHDDGSSTTWTYAELDRRSRLAAWRLRALGLQPGDRVLSWGPSSPALAAAYIGAIRARLIIVPLDLRMSRDAITNIRERAVPSHLLVGTGRDAPDPEAMGIADLPATGIDDLSADPDPSVPPDWDAQVRTWERPAPDEIWDLIFTSGTTGSPKGVMLAHDNLLATIRLCHAVAPEIDFRIVSVLPLSHLFEQAIGLFFALDVGAHILYVRIGNPRQVVDALRDHRVTAMILVPQVLDLFWSAIEREVDRSGRRSSFEWLRRIARRLPFAARRLLFRSIHARFGGTLQLFVSSGAFLPPGLQQAWEDVGVRILQGYGSTENGFGTFNTIRDHGLGTVGRPVPPVELRIADDGEVLFRGPTLFKGYWRDPESTARAIDDEGWYHSGDMGHLDPDGRLILSGRTKDRIALPNGFKVYPEDIENALRIAGLRDTVVVETRPGRIEAVVLRGVVPETDPADFKSTVDAAVRKANAALGPNQRLAGWQLWPDEDFPRTHTLKIRRDPIREWATSGTEKPREAAAGA
jgi:long-chain acyl-CoA synthetase